MTKKEYISQLYQLRTTMRSTNNAVEQWQQCKVIENNLMRAIREIKNIEYRIILTLRHIYFMKWQEIATITHCNHKEICVLHGKALKALPIIKEKAQ